MTDSSHKSIGDRAFSNQGDKVIKRAGAYLKGLQKAGVYGV